MKGKIKITSNSTTGDFIFSKWIPSIFYLDDINISNDNRYFFIKHGLLINNDILLIINNNDDFSDELLNNKSTKATLLKVEEYDENGNPIKDDNGNIKYHYELKINDKSFTVYNPMNKTFINEYCQINKINVIIDTQIEFDASTYSNIKYLGYYIIDTSQEISTFSNFDFSSFDFYADSHDIQNTTNIYKIDSIEIDIDTSTINYSKINITYNFGFNESQCKIITNDRLPVGDKVLEIDNIEWRVLQESFNSGIFTYVCIPNKLYLDMNNYDYKDNTCDISNFDLNIKRTLGTKNQLFEEPYLASDDSITEYLLNTFSEQKIKIESITKDDLTLPEFDFSNSDINYIKYMNISNDIKNFDYTYDLLQRNKSKRIVNTLFALQDVYNRPLLPIEYKYDIINSNITENENKIKYLGSLLFASDGEGDYPVSRFTYFYNAYLQMTPHQNNIYNFDNGKFKLIDGEYIYVPPNLEQDDIDPMSPERIVKFASSQPIIPTGGQYLDSLLPQLIPWEQSVVLFSLYKDSTGNIKSVPVKNGIKTYNYNEIRNIINNDTQYWTKTVANFQSLSKLDDIEIKNSFVYIKNKQDIFNDDIYNKFNYEEILFENQISVNSLLKVDNNMYTFTDSDLFKRYLSDYKLPTFINLASVNKNNNNNTTTIYTPEGFFYRIKFIHKKLLESARQGFAFHMNMPKLTIVYDCDTNNIRIFYRDLETGLLYEVYDFEGQENVKSNIHSDNDYIDFFSLDFNKIKNIFLDLSSYTDGKAIDTIIPQYIENIIILPSKKDRIEQHIIIKLLTSYFYVSFYNFSSPLYCGIPYINLNNPYNITNPVGTIITNGKTFETINKYTNPIITDSIIMKKSVNINSINDISNNLFGLSKFPCKVKFSDINGNEYKTDYLLTKIEYDIENGICIAKFTVDNRNEFYNNIILKDTYPKILPKFELRRRLCNFGYPGEYIWKPPIAIDTFIKKKLVTILQNTYSSKNNLGSGVDFTITENDIDLDVKGSYKLPSTIYCTLDDIIKLPNQIPNNKNCVCKVYDCGDKDESTIETSVPFQMNVDKAVYVGMSFDFMTLLYDYDSMNDISIDISLLDETIGKSKIVYPKKDATELSINLKTEIPNFITLKIDSVTRNNKFTLINSATDKSIRNIQVSCDIPKQDLSGSDNITYNIRTLSLRADNDLFFVWNREDILLRIYENNTVIDSFNLTEENKNQNKKWINYLSASTASEQMSEDLPKSINANSILFRFNDKKTQDNISRTFDLELPYSSKNFNFSNLQNGTLFEPIIYVRVTSKCDIEFITSSGENVKIALSPGSTIPVTLMNPNNIYDWINDNTNIKITNIIPGTEIEVYGLQMYTNQSNLEVQTTSESWIDNIYHWLFG